MNERITSRPTEAQRDRESKSKLKQPITLGEWKEMKEQKKRTARKWERLTKPKE